MATITAVRFIDAIAQRLNAVIALPYWQDRLIASYTTRSFAASDAQFGAIRHPIKIDQQPGPTLARGAVVKDDEAGAGRIADSVELARQGHKFVVYCPRLQSGFSLAEHRQAMHNARIPAGHVAYWVADWGFSEAHALQFMADNADVVAVQWASPTTNRGLAVPGANGATVGSLNVDLSVGRKDFWLPAPPKPAVRHASGVWRAEIELDVDQDVASIRPLPGQKATTSSVAGPARHRLIDVDLHTGVWDIHRLEGKA